MYFFGYQDKSIENLSKALEVYEMTVRSGEYLTFDTPLQRNWTNTEEVELLTRRAKCCAEKLGAPDMEPDEALREIERECPINLPSIAHFCASLSLLESQKSVPEPSLEWFQFYNTTTNILVEEGMPTACLVFLGALRYSSHDELVKLSIIDGVIHNLYRTNHFGILRDPVLRVAIHDWMDIVERHTGRNLKTELVDEIEEYSRIKESCETIDAIREKATVVERYLLHSWAKFKNHLGDIEENMVTTGPSMRP